MLLNFEDQELESLLSQYNHQIEILKEKIMNGGTWEDLSKNRGAITQLAIAINKALRFSRSQGR